MVRHVIVWKLKEEDTEAEKSSIRAGIREGLEGLAGKIPGLVKIQVNTEGLPSSNADLMLDSLFEDEQARKGYSVHPDHVPVANTKFRPYGQSRLWVD